jgi:predicted DNA-binding transcriptional regulator AlpA
VAKRLGIGIKTLSRYIAENKVPAPQIIEVGGRKIHVWTEHEIAALRQLLPKIANGRKTRYKKQPAISNQQSAKTKAPARVPVPHKKQKPKKK